MVGTESLIQGTDAWIKAKLGHVSGSGAADVMTNARKKGEVSKTADRYLRDLIGEHLTEKPASTLKTWEMEWGNRWEPVAREAYMAHTGNQVEQVGFVKHGCEEFIGCSPDGLVGSDGLLQVKCPVVAAFHLDAMLDPGKFVAEHWPQVQFEMWITGRMWNDLESYHNDFPPRWRLIVIRVERDETYITELSRRSIEFRDEMLRRLNLIVERWE